MVGVSYKERPLPMVLHVKVVVDGDPPVLTLMSLGDLGHKLLVLFGCTYPGGALA